VSDLFVHFVFLGEELFSKDLPYIYIIPRCDQLYTKSSSRSQETIAEPAILLC
jgi:hypothetical protein